MLFIAERKNSQWEVFPARIRSVAEKFGELLNTGALSGDNIQAQLSGSARDHAHMACTADVSMDSCVHTKHSSQRRRAAKITL